MRANIARSALPEWEIYVTEGIGTEFEWVASVKIRRRRGRRDHAHLLEEFVNNAFGECDKTGSYPDEAEQRRRLRAWVQSQFERWQKMDGLFRMRRRPAGIRFKPFIERKLHGRGRAGPRGPAAARRAGRATISKTSFSTASNQLVRLRIMIRTATYGPVNAQLFLLEYGLPFA
jgi:hypothetical protein